MPRVKRGSARRNKRKKVLKLTKGFFLGKSKKDTEQFLTIEHTYDAYNRPHEVINPFTGTQQYAYSYSGGSLHLTATNTSSGQWSTVITDATGKKVRSLDDGGELKYTYDSWGQVKRVHHDGLLTLRNEYDAFGRQELLWAPNAGTTRYKYNPFGQLTWQKNREWP